MLNSAPGGREIRLFGCDPIALKCCVKFVSSSCQVRVRKNSVFIRLVSEVSSFHNIYKKFVFPLSLFYPQIQNPL